MRKTMRQRLQVSAAIAAAACLTLSACSGAGESGDSQTDGETSARQQSNSLVVLAEQDPGTLDYTTSLLTALRTWIPNIVEPLVYIDDEGQAAGAVAESWTVSDDGKTYTFTLRSGIKFSNGAAVTMDDVMYSLDVMRKSSLSDQSAVYSSVESITKLDDRQFQIVLSAPSRTFWAGMGSVGALIQPESEAATIATNPIGTGPYMVESYVSNGDLKLTANPNYWGTPPAIKDIDIKIVPDGSSRINAMKAGEADVYVPTRDWDQAVAAGLDKSYQIVSNPSGGEPFYVVVNQKLDPDLRQAIAHTVDPTSFSKIIDDSPWRIVESCTFAMQNRPWWQAASAASCPYDFNIDTAAEMVADGGFGSTTIEFVGISDIPFPARDLLVANMKSAGLQVDFQNPDLARYSQTIFSGNPPDFDVTMMSGPDALTQWLCSDGKTNWATYCSPEYNALLAKADAASTPEEYNDIMAQAVELLQKDAVVITWGANSSGGLINKNLQGWSDPLVPKSINLASLSWK